MGPYKESDRFGEPTAYIVVVALVVLHKPAVVLDLVSREGARTLTSVHPGYIASTSLFRAEIDVGVVDDVF